MATINDIASGSQYQGNSALGGFVPTVITLDTKPLEQLTAFTVMQNKALYDQRQKDTDASIAELASLTAFDVANSLPQFVEQGTQAAIELREKAIEITRTPPKNATERIKQKYELQKLRANKEAEVIALNAKNLSYRNQLAQIDAAPASEAKKKVLRDRLDAMFKDLKWDSRTPNLPNYTVELNKVKPPVTSEVDFIQKGANGVTTSTLTNLFISGKNNEQAILEAQGFDKQLPANATPEQIAEYELKNADGTGSAFVDASRVYNDIIAKGTYVKKDANGQPIIENGVAVQDLDKMKREVPQIATLFTGLQKFNEYNKVQEDYRKQGLFSGAGAEIINEGSFYQIDPSQPLQTNDLIVIEKFLQAPASSKKLKYDYTGEATSSYNARTSRMNAETSRGQLALSQKEYEDKLAALKKAGGNLTPGQIADYPYLKTREFFTSIGVDGKQKLVNNFTAEQKKVLGAITGQDIENGMSVRVNADGKLELIKPIEGNAKKGEVVASALSDDVSKFYYDDVNKTDSGKENLRSIFDFNATFGTQPTPTKEQQKTADPEFDDFMKKNGLK